MAMMYARYLRTCKDFYTDVNVLLSQRSIVLDVYEGLMDWQDTSVHLLQLRFRRKSSLLVKAISILTAEGNSRTAFMHSNVLFSAGIYEPCVLSQW